MSKNVILYFVKFPEPGKVKTRLARTIGEEEAACIYRGLAEEIYKTLRSLKNVYVTVVFDPPDKASQIKEWLSAADEYLAQQGADLGERLSNAFKWAFDKGYQHCAAVGSDILELKVPVIEEAFIALDTTDVVIGPAEDGGYYLIGSSSFQPELFKEISWSTDIVLQQTYSRISKLGLSYQTLVPLEDLDEMKIGDKI